MKTSQAVTVQYDFLPCTESGDPLFSVRAGIPVDDALDQLSLMFGATVDAVELLTSEKDTQHIPGALRGSVHQMHAQYALLQAIHGGLLRHVDATSKASKS